MGLCVLSLFGSGTRPFCRALAQPPAIAQVLEADYRSLQVGLGQHKLTPGAGDTPQLAEAGSNTHWIAQLLVERQTLLSQPLKRQVACIQERLPGCYVQRPGP